MRMVEGVVEGVVVVVVVVVSRSLCIILFVVLATGSLGLYPSCVDQRQIQVSVKEPYQR